MRGYIYTVKDKIAKNYMPIFEANNDQVALRDFRQQMANLPKEINRNDFELIKLGEILRIFDYESKEQKEDVWIESYKQSVVVREVENES